MATVARQAARRAEEGETESPREQREWWAGSIGGPYCPSEPQGRKRREGAHPGERESERRSGKP